MKYERRLVMCWLWGLLALGLFWTTPDLHAAPQSGQTAELADAAAAVRQCGVSSPLVDRILAESVEGRMTGEDVLSLLAALDRACASGVPLYPLEAKVEEGLGKRVPAIRIVPVLVTLQESLQRTSLALHAGGRAVSDEDVATIATAVSQGLPFDTVVRLLREYPAAPGADVAAAVKLAGQLRKAGVSDGDVNAFLDAGLVTEGVMPRWGGFPRLFMLARRQGVDAESVMSQAQQLLREGGTLPELYNALGITSRDIRQGAGGSGHVSQ